MISRGTLLTAAIPAATTFVIGSNPVSTATVIGASIFGGGSALTYFTKYPTRDGASEFLTTLGWTIFSGAVTATGIAVAKSADALPYDERPLNTTVLTGLSLFAGAGCLAARHYINVRAEQLRHKDEEEALRNFIEFQRHHIGEQRADVKFPKLVNDIIAAYHRINAIHAPYMTQDVKEDLLSFSDGQGYLNIAFLNEIKESAQGDHSKLSDEDLASVKEYNSLSEEQKELLEQKLIKRSEYTGPNVENTPQIKSLYDQINAKSYKLLATPNCADLLRQANDLIKRTLI